MKALQVCERTNLVVDSLIKCSYSSPYWKSTLDYNLRHESSLFIRWRVQNETKTLHHEISVWLSNSREVFSVKSLFLSLNHVCVNCGGFRLMFAKSINWPSNTFTEWFLAVFKSVHNFISESQFPGFTTPRHVLGVLGPWFLVNLQKCLVTLIYEDHRRW